MQTWASGPTFTSGESACSRARLGQLLRGQDAEREPDVDERGRELLGDADAAFPHRLEAHALDVRHALVDAGERPAFEQIRRVDRVAGRPELVGEGDHAERQPLGVMEEQDLGHGYLAIGRMWRVGPL